MIHDDTKPTSVSSKEIHMRIIATQHKQHPTQFIGSSFNKLTCCERLHPIEGKHFIFELSNVTGVMARVA